MRGDPLPDPDQIVRYVRPSSIDGANIDGSAFRLRPGEHGLSVNWLQALPGDKLAQLAEIRRLRRLQWKSSGRLAELIVGHIKARLADELPGIAVIHAPLEAQNGLMADPSHAEIHGLPDGSTVRAALIGDIIAECVSATHPALVSPAAGPGP